MLIPFPASAYYSPCSRIKFRPNPFFSPSPSFSFNFKPCLLYSYPYLPSSATLSPAPARINALPFDFASTLEAAAVLTAIVVVHESGHFLAASLQGIHVTKFAVGFGPVLAKFIANNVEYSLRAFPLGGFVAFPDNDPNTDIPPDDPNLLKNRPILDRFLVISAGVLANIIFAYLIIFAQVLSVGLPVQEPFPGVLVPQVRPFSAASRDGLLPGDVILAINGYQLPNTGPDVVSRVVDVIRKNPKTNVYLKVERGKQDVPLRITPDVNLDGTGKIGVQLSPNLRITKLFPQDIFQAFSFTSKEFWDLTYNVLDSLKQTFLNFSQSASKVSGPVAIIAVGAEVARWWFAGPHSCGGRSRWQKASRGIGAGHYVLWDCACHPPGTLPHRSGHA